MSTDVKSATVKVQTNHGLEYTVRVAELSPQRRFGESVSRREPIGGSSKAMGEPVSGHHP